MQTEPSGTTTSVRAIADTFHARWLATYPFVASIYGITGYDDRVSDDSEEGEAARRAELESVLADLDGFDPAQLSEADAVTLGCLVENVHQELRDIDARLIEHTVSAMPVGGPPILLGLAARTVITDAQAADDYLERLRRSGNWLDQQTERLRIGAAKGRLPVAPFVVEAIDRSSSASSDVRSASMPGSPRSRAPMGGCVGTEADRLET